MSTEDGELFLAYFAEPVSDAEVKRAETLFETYRLDEKVILLWAKNPIPASAPSDLFRMDEPEGPDDNAVTGVVFKLNGSFAGYYDKGLWKWLRE